jgi:hypothetical protein
MGVLWQSVSFFQKTKNERLSTILERKLRCCVVRCLTLMSLVSKGHVAPRRRELEHASLSQHRPPVSPPHQPSINLPWPPPSPRTKLASRHPPHTPTARGSLTRAIALACRSAHSSTQAPTHIRPLPRAGHAQCHVKSPSRPSPPFHITLGARTHLFARAHHVK